MKLVTAILRPEVLNKVREGLCDVDIPGMTVTEVKGFGKQKDTQNFIVVPSLRLSLFIKLNLKSLFLIKI